jgi:putative glutamine amidotransferase
MNRQVVAKPNVAISSAIRDDQAPDPDDEVVRHIHALEHSGARGMILHVGEDPETFFHRYRIDGLLLTGGADLGPDLYGGHRRPYGAIDPERDATEIATLTVAFQRGLPVFGVCRGMQLLSVFLGGSLVDDLPTSLGRRYRLPHDQLRETDLKLSEYAHSVEVVPGSRLHEIAEVLSFDVNSSHRQAVRKVKMPLAICATADDFVPEAIENVFGDSFLLGVQWHPESLIGHDEVAQRLYRAFVKRCSVTQ